MKENKGKIVVGLSGGVDSSVSLLLLKKQGYQPVGVSFKYDFWKSKKNKLKENVCCSEESFAIAREICQRLDVPYYIINDKVNFKDKVIKYFLETLKEKKTPNPCLVCNRFVKFKKLIEFAQKEKIEYIATGHYAQIKEKDGEYFLSKPKDEKKDQTYFLALLRQKELSRIIFPLANYTKEEVYQIAQKEGFEFFEKIKQSQDLCFVSSQSTHFFLEKKLGLEPGKIVDKEGNILGDHRGLYFYTIGQRKGINLSDGPWYVVNFDKKKNWLIISKEEKDLLKKEVILSNFNFTSGQNPKKPIKVMAKTRFNQDLSSAKLFPPKGERMRIVFDKPEKAMTPGQWAVFYSKDVCLGGGIIELVN